MDKTFSQSRSATKQRRSKIKPFVTKKQANQLAGKAKPKSKARLPSKRIYERAERIVRKYRDAMYEKENEARAEKIQWMVGKCFKFTDRTSTEEWDEYAMVIDVTPDGIDFIHVMTARSNFGVGEGHAGIERTNWSLGMEETYLNKDTQVSEEDFIDAFNDTMRAINKGRK